jgi:deoxycytidylate deaminase
MNHEHWFEKAAQVAKLSKCDKAQCGTVIVKDNQIIGQGYNSPPGKKRCNIKKSEYDQKVTDKTCCIHAEQRAILDALKKGNNLQGSFLYFMRIKDNKKTFAGEPYCTICSKMALDTGIKEFILWHQDGIKSYDTEEYNELSFNYKS